jgi:hypothetical protein
MPATNRLRWILLTVFVILAGAVVGTLFGFLSATLYEMDRTAASRLHYLPPLLGAVGGTGAGLLWCTAMRGILGGKAAGLGKCVAWGGVFGIVAGAVATTILHTSLTLISLATSPDAPRNARQVVALLFPAIAMIRVAYGLLFGLPAGCVTGLLCGALVRLVLGRKTPRPSSSPQVKTQ